MIKRILLTVITLLVSADCFFSQMPTCPNPKVYMDGGAFIQCYDPSLPLGPSNPSLTTIPNCPGGGGLALMPNINGGTLTPTFYSVSGGTYWWWNGAVWVNTGNGTGNGAAVNLGGCGSFIYNLVGGTGQVYVYNGAGTGTLLTTIANFNGGGPYDIVCDCNCNFFLLNTTLPNQSLTMYSPAGVPTCSYSLINFPNATAGGGFAIIGNQIYVKNNLANGFFIGTLAGASVTFTQFPGFLPSPGDFACCPSCPTLAVVASSGTLGCGQTTTNVFATTTVAAVTYSWAGPGMVGPVNASVGVVNQPGVYTCTVSSGGCPPTQSIVTTTVVSTGVIVNAVITPTGNICLSGPTQLMVSPNSPTNIISWTGPGIQAGANTPTVTINAPGLYSVSISNTVNACAGSATVMVYQSPTLGIAYSSNTVCAQNFNGSPNSITLTPSGATNYTLLTTPNYSTSSPNGPNMPITPVAPYQSVVTIGSNTLIGVNGFCSATITSNFSIAPNPTVSVVPTASICQGNSYTYTATGADSFTWSPQTGLNAVTGPTVVASPTITTLYTVYGGSFGCNSSNQLSNLVVYANPTITINPATPTVCAGNTVNLTGNGAASYAWSPPAGLTSTTGANVGASPVATSVYTVLGTTNTCTNVAVVTVSVIPVPNLYVSSGQSAICLGQSTQLLVNGASGFSWTPSYGLSNVTGPFTTASPVNSTTYTIVGNNGICIGSTSIAIEVIQPPSLSVGSNNYQICRGLSTNITATGAQTYSWMPAQSLSSNTVSSVVASPSVSTNYTIMGSNSSGSVSCTQVVMYSVSVIPYAQAILPASATLCLGDKIDIGVSGGNTYDWYPSSGLSNTSGYIVSASPKISTIYTVISSYNGNCPGTGTINVIVRPNPVVNAGKDVSFNADDMKFIKATGTGVLTWVEGDGIWCKVCPETQLFTTQGGCYQVEAVNEYGCKAKDEVCVEILHDFGVYIPNTFTPNNDGVNDVFLVFGYSITDVSMTIFDRWGEKLFTSKDQTIGWPGTYKGAECENGTYVFKIEYKGIDGKAYFKTGHVNLSR